jgi:hypothetical protein
VFYINILNQPPQERQNPEIPGSTTEVEQKNLAQHRREKLRKIHQRIRENYRLERHFLS